MQHTVGQRSLCTRVMHSLAVPSTNCLHKPMLNGTCPTAYGLHNAKDKLLTAGLDMPSSTLSRGKLRWDLLSSGRGALQAG